MPEKYLRRRINLFSTILSDEMALYIKTRKFHCNIPNESFIELHKLFQSQYTNLAETIDSVAERINKFNGKKIGTTSEFTHLTRLKKSPDKYLSQKEMIKELLGDHEWVIKQFGKDIEECEDKNKDEDIMGFLTGVIQQHKTTALIFRRYLK